jgi:hypothetical protein
LQPRRYFAERRLGCLFPDQGDLVAAGEAAILDRRKPRRAVFIVDYHTFSASVRGRQARDAADVDRYLVVVREHRVLDCDLPDRLQVRHQWLAVGECRRERSGQDNSSDRNKDHAHNPPRIVDPLFAHGCELA